MNGALELLQSGAVRGFDAMVVKGEENLSRLRFVRISMNVIQFELDSSPLNSVSASLGRANAALFQLRTRLKEVVTGHNNTLEVMLCAQKPSATHSEPSEKVSSSSSTAMTRP